METLAPLFTALIALSMAISTLIRGARERLHQEYSYLAGVISIVFLCLFFLLLSDEQAWRYCLLVSALLVAPASAQVFTQILRPYAAPFRRLVPILYLLTLLQLGAIILVGPISAWVIASNAVLVFGGLLVQLIMISSLSRRLERPIEQSRLRYLFWSGSLAVLAMGLEMAFIDWNFYWAGPEGQDLFFPPFGSLATAGYIYFLGQTILRHRLLDRHEIVSRIVVFIVMAMLLGAVYGVLVRLIGQPTGPLAEAVDILIASILVLILYDPVKVALERQVERYLARERSQHIAALLDMKNRLPGLIEVNPLLDTLFDGTLQTGRIDLASIYFYDEVRAGFRLRRWEGDPELTLMPAFAPRPFIDGFLEGRSSYLLEELETSVDRSPTPDWVEGAIASMRSLQADLCLPLRIGPTVIGVWNLRAKPASPSFSEEELDLLGEVANQAAVMIDNSRSFERLKERDRLAALGEMSAGLAHEIRNPLGAIKGAVQVLSRPTEQRESRSAEFLGIIVEEVDRLDGVVRQFLDYARPMNMRVEPVPPGLLISSVLAMVAAERLPSGVRVDYEPNEGVPELPMDVEKLKQVVINVVRNGIDSMRTSGGQLTVRVRGLGTEDDPGRATSLRTRGPRAGRSPDVRVKRGHMAANRCVEMSFEDQGSGINPEDAAKLFIPFFTTKSEGTGLGLPICERIVREHGGEIEIESSRGVGTRFTLRLPLDSPDTSEAQDPASVPTLDDVPEATRRRLAEQPTLDDPQS